MSFSFLLVLLELNSRAELEKTKFSSWFSLLRAVDQKTKTNRRARFPKGACGCVVCASCLRLPWNLPKKSTSCTRAGPWAGAPEKSSKNNDDGVVGHATNGQWHASLARTVRVTEVVATVPKFLQQKWLKQVSRFRFVLFCFCFILLLKLLHYSSALICLYSNML